MTTKPDEPVAKLDVVNTMIGENGRRKREARGLPPDWQPPAPTPLDAAKSVAGETGGFKDPFLND